MDQSRSNRILLCRIYYFPIELMLAADVDHSFQCGIEGFFEVGAVFCYIIETYKIVPS